MRARRWVKSGNQIELVKSVLRFRRDLDVIFVILLDLGDLWAIDVMVAVRVTALNASGFHCMLGFGDSSNLACSNGPSGLPRERGISSWI